MGQERKSHWAQRLLAWESREVLWRSRGSGGPPPSLAAGVDGHVNPSGQRDEDFPQLWHPGCPCIAECSSGSDWVVGTHGPSGLLAFSSLSPVFPSATWCRFGRTPGFSVMGSRGKVSTDRTKVGCQPSAIPQTQSAVSLKSDSMIPCEMVLSCKIFPETQRRDMAGSSKITPQLSPQAETNLESEGGSVSSHLPSTLVLFLLLPPPS